MIGVWEFGQSCEVSPGLKCYEVRDPLDLAVLAAALAGACGGFLWWNASPAKIFMGDVGSLALGGGIAGIAITLRTQLLLVILGFIFVLITASVILQVVYFKISGGKRIFKMAPLQHHFELICFDLVSSPSTPGAYLFTNADDRSKYEENLDEEKKNREKSSEPMEKSIDLMKKLTHYLGK